MIAQLLADAAQVTWVPLAAGVWWFYAAAAVSAYSSIVGGQAAARAQREAAKVSELQGEIAVIQSEFQAKQALKQGRQQAEYIRGQSAQAVSTRVTRTAAAGVEISGSPMAVISDEIWAGEKAAAGALKNSIARAGQIEASGQAQRAQGDANAAALRSNADTTEQAGWLKAVASGMNAYAYGQGMTGGAASGPPPAYGAPVRGSPYYTSFSE